MVTSKLLKSPIQGVHTPAAARKIQCRGRMSRALEELMGMQEEEVVRPKLKPHSVLPAHAVPDTIPKPPWYMKPGQNIDYSAAGPEIHDEAGIAKMRAAGKLASQVLAMAGTMAKPGVTTEAIDKAVHEMIIANGAYPSPLRYGKPPFPKSVCTSVNEVVCHGIPDMRPLQSGDIINIDVTVFLNGYHGDTSRTFFVGEIMPTAKRLVNATKKALDAGIAVCRPNADFKEIGAAISKVAQQEKFNVVRDFCGHGVGKIFHASPTILHFTNNERYGKMQVGQTFTIEPMLSEGSIRPKYWQDGWTAVTSDGKLSAQFEHTLLITKDGVEILTAYE